MAVWDSAQQSPDTQHSHPWLAKALFALDDILRRRLAVVEYSRHPACIFRVEIARASRQVTLSDGTRLGTCDRVAQLHFWNAHIPTVPRNGSTIRWARRMQQSIAISLRELARYLSGRDDLSDVAAICADVPCATRSQTRQIAHIMAYYGFETITEDERLPIPARIHRFGENMLISLTVFAQNAGALRLDSLTRVRVPIYISRAALQARFGDFLEEAVLETAEAS